MEKTPITKFLKPEVVSRLKNLELIARYIVEGFLVGLHKSPFHGFSVEFSEHRQYMPGDNIRDIDWKVYGRTNRFYIKQYEEETNLKAYILLDVSGSMRYTSHQITKLDYARYLAAALSFLFLKQRDATGLVVFSDKIHQFLPPRATSSYIKYILKILNEVQPSQTETHISRTLHITAEKIKRRGLIVLLTEFLFEDQEAILQGLRHFRYYGHEVLVFNILDPNDRLFNFTDEATFKDMETGEEVKTQPYLLRNQYRKMIDEFYDHLKQECLNMGVDFQNIFTNESFHFALLRYLLKRQKLY